MCVHTKSGVPAIRERKDKKRLLYSFRFTRDPSVCVSTLKSLNKASNYAKIDYKASPHSTETSNPTWSIRSTEDRVPVPGRDACRKTTQRESIFYVKEACKIDFVRRRGNRRHLNDQLARRTKLEQFEWFFNPERRKRRGNRRRKYFAISCPK